MTSRLWKLWQGTTLGALMLFGGLTQGGVAHSLDQETAQRRVLATEPSAEEQAIRLLLLGSVLASRNHLPAVIDVPDHIREKYESIRSTILGGGVIVTLTGGAFGYASYQSIMRTEFTRESINRTWALLKPSAQWSAKAWNLLWQSRIVEFVGRQSARSSTYSYNKIQPVLAIIFSKGMKYATASSVLGSSFYTSIYLGTHDAREVMTSETARSLLNYDEAFDRKLNLLITKTAMIYSLEPYQQALLKNGIRNELMNLAIEKKFRIEDSEGNPVVYQVDLKKIMLKQNMIDLEISDAAEHLSSITQLAWDHKPEISSLERLGASLETIVDIAAILESILESRELPEAMEMEVRQKLANTHRFLARVRNNLAN